MENSTNILVIGETGHGKSPWIIIETINITLQLALKDDELNNIALKKDKKYGFTQKDIKENINEENKTEVLMK